MKDIAIERVMDVMRSNNIQSEENFEELVKYLEMPYGHPKTKDSFLDQLNQWLKDEKTKAIAHLLFHLKRFIKLTQYFEK